MPHLRAEHVRLHELLVDGWSFASSLLPVGFGVQIIEPSSKVVRGRGIKGQGDHGSESLEDKSQQGFFFLWLRRSQKGWINMILILQHWWKKNGHKNCWANMSFIESHGAANVAKELKGHRVYLIPTEGPNLEMTLSFEEEFDPLSATWTGITE